MKTEKFYSLTTCLVGISAIAAALVPVSAFANPQDGVVAAGQATITSTGPKLDIHQTTNKAVIDWRTFDIAPGEHTQFHQPSSSSLTLNRVNAAHPSQINGQLSANGHVVIVNPNGVFFGAGAQVDVGGLTATTADISNENFMNGNMKFDRPGNPNAKVVNNGTITAKEAGLVNLVAPQVENHGVIEARLGKVTLASGEIMTLDLAGDGLVQLEVTADQLQNQHVTNTGRITADGGTVLLTAAAAREIVDSHVTNTGIIQARTVDGDEGKVTLHAEGANKTNKQGASTVLAGGTIDVSAPTQGKAGKVEVLADHVAVLADAHINASGVDGGGTIHIGGEYAGKGTTPTALVTIVQQGAVLNANALDHGDGGEVIVWADNRTDFNGHIEAMGGVNGGSGGFVETSGKLFLNFNGTGRVYARDDESDNGEWLLDPADVTISGGADSNIGGSPNFAPTGTAAVINVGSITALLDAGTNVTITTSNDGHAGNGDITVSSAISKTAGTAATLTLSAYRNIIVNAAIQSSSGQTLNIVLQANNADTGSGYVAVNASLGTTSGSSGNITIGGGSNIATGYAWGNADQAAGVAINAGMGTASRSITIRGHGYDNGGSDNNYGVYIAGGTSGNSGHYTVTGVGGAGANNNHGIYVNGVTITASSSGNRSFTGTGGGTGSNNYGVYVAGGGIIRSTNGTGVTVTGTGGGGGAGTDNYGVYVTGGGSQIATTGSGSVTITGTGGNLAGSGGTNHGVYSNVADGIQTTGSGNITLTGIRGGQSTSNGIYVDAGNSVHTSGTGSITLISDNIAAHLTSNCINSVRNLTLKNYTAGTSIGLSGGSGTLALNIGLDNLSIGSGYTLTIGDSGGTTGDVDLNTWDLSAKTYHVEIYGNDIDVGGLTLGSGNFLAHAYDVGGDTGELNVSADTTKAVAGTSTLTLRADRDITIATNVDHTASASAVLNVVLNADRDNDGDGALQFNAGTTITTLGGYAVLGGGSGTLGGTNGILGDGDGSGADDDFAVGSSSNTVGVNLGGTNISTGAGQLIVNGIGYGDTTANRFGVYLNGATLQSTSGNIKVKGQGGGSGGVGNTGYGVYISNSGTITTTTSGNIEIVGIRGAGAAASNYGFRAVATNGVHTQGTGNITITTDFMQVNQTNTINAARNLTIKNYTTDGSAGIGLGGGSGTLNLDDTTLSTYISVGSGYTLTIGDSAGTTGDIDLDSWDLSAKTYHVEIYGNDIDIGGVTLGTGNFLAHAYDIAGPDLGVLNVSAAITKSVAGTSTLTLKADGSITNSSNADVTSTTGTLHMIFWSDADADSDGYISLAGATITSNSGNVYMVGGLDDGSNGGTASDGIGDGYAWGNATVGSGITFNNTDPTLGSGNLLMRGHGYNNAASTGAGVNLYSTGSVIQSTSGSIGIYGVGGNGASDNHGIYYAGAGNLITSATGAITLAGTSGNSGGSKGLYLYDGARVTSTGAVGAGDVTLHGTGVGNNSQGVGIYIGSNQPFISSVSGDIRITGVGSNSGSAAGVAIQRAHISSTGSDADAANIIITGTAGSSNANAHGVLIDGNSTTDTYIETVAGDVSITGTAVHASAGGINVQRGGIIRSTGSGDITLTGINTAGSGIMGATSNSTLGDSAMTGILSLIADRVDLTYLTLGTSATGSILIKAYTDGTSMGLGGGSGALNLDDTELTNIGLTGTLTIGDASGNDGDVDIDSWDLSAKTYQVNLFGNDIDVGGMTLGTGDVYIYAQDLGGDLGVLTISAAITKAVAGTSVLALNADQDLIVSSGANITASTGSLDIGLMADTDVDADGLISLGAVTFTSNGGGIDLNAVNDGITLTGNVTFTAGAGALAIAGDVNGAFDLTATADNFTLTGTMGQGTALDDVSLTSVDELVLPTITAGSIFARTTGATSDLVIDNISTLTASKTGDAITLVAKRDFINNAGAGALVTSHASGRFLVYSTDPADSTMGSLANDFVRYSCSYGGACPSFAAETGDGFLYTTTPMLTVTLDDATITYGDDPAALLTGHGYTLSGYLGTDAGDDNITGALNADSSYDQYDTIGSYDITYLNGTLASALGYGFTYADGDLTVNAKGLAVTATAQSKAAGAGDPALTYNYTGLVGPDVTATFAGALARAAGETAGAYAITQGTLAASGNYTISSFTGSLLTITGGSAPPPTPPVSLPSTVDYTITQPSTSPASNSHVASNHYAAGASYIPGQATGEVYIDSVFIDPTVSAQFQNMDGYWHLAPGGNAPDDLQDAI